jgi:hypothetical protein
MRGIRGLNSLVYKPQALSRLVVFVVPAHRVKFASTSASASTLNLGSAANMADNKIAQPEWNAPQRSTPEPVLKLYNSLTKTKAREIDSDYLACAMGLDENIDRVCSIKREACQVVQLRADGVRRVAYRTCSVRTFICRYRSRF